jgi:hypothetical protein
MKEKFIANKYSSQFGCQGLYIKQNDIEQWNLITLDLDE